MRIARDNHTIFHVIAANDAARGHSQIENRIARRRELVNHLPRRSAAVVSPRVALFENDNAAALDALVARVHRRRNEIGEPDIGDEAAALFHLQDWLFARLPFHNAQLSIEHARVHANIGNWLSQAECTAPRFAIFAGLGRRGQLHVMPLLFGSTTLVNWSQRQATGQTRRCRAAIHPSEFKRHQCESQVLGTRKQSAVLRIHEHSRNAGAIKGIEEHSFFRSPVMGIAAAAGH